MSQTINFGIDLGTTNSLIAKYQSGKVEIFKNPISLKETLPSVIAYRKERVIVGDKAREMVEKDPTNVFSLFKRKMGTAESFFVKSIGEERTPIQLSAAVLKELKNFVHTGESVESVVLTIPASFDTIQSNATKKAGYEAGFQEVVLLQEPIAASLAFANKQDKETDLTGQWLVYDLGGGTFDVALVRFEDGEMRVIDHEGDNFLGGLDFDNLIIEQIVVPYLKTKGDFGNILDEMRASDGQYNKLYYELRIKAEEAKIQLSNSPTTEIEFNIVDRDGEEHEIFLIVFRENFENIIREKIGYTVDLIQNVLEKNNLKNTDIQQIIFIGGSTYIPLVKRMISEQLNIKVNQSVDPTNAVAVGAAFYAGSKTKNLQGSNNFTPSVASSLAMTSGGISANMSSETGVNLKTAFQKTTQDREEYFTALATNISTGMTYRITRQDGGFDTGSKPLMERISDILPLVTNQLNVFTLKTYDAQGNNIPNNVPSFEIVQGKFSLYGQPLPNDICIEVDDFDNNTTKLEVIFEKNSILPLKKTLVKSVSKTIPKGSEDSLIINVLEGSKYASPAACLPLGIIEFKGKDLVMNLVKGSDVEIVIEISESRDLKISTVLLMTDQEVSDIFSPSARVVNIEKLKTETLALIRTARRELTGLEAREEYALAGRVNKTMKELEDIYEQLKTLSEKDVRDTRYQLEERKRKLAQLLDAALGDQQAEGIKQEYFEQKRYTQWRVENNENPTLKDRFERIIRNEREFLASNTASLIKSKIREMQDLSWKVEQNDPVYLSHLFHHYASLEDYPDKKKAKNYIDIGEKALERKNYDELKSAIYGLYALLPEEKRTEERIKGTGLG
jgi:molecular chaperone DnaK